MLRVIALAVVLVREGKGEYFFGVGWADGFCGDYDDNCGAGDVVWASSDDWSAAGEGAAGLCDSQFGGDQCGADCGDGGLYVYDCGGGDHASLADGVCEF
jgi:hypothetical protein